MIGDHREVSEFCLKETNKNVGARGTLSSVYTIKLSSVLVSPSAPPTVARFPSACLGLAGN